LKIYTGFGDTGRTQLFGGQVVDKDDLRVEAYGAADELNSHLGLIISHLKKNEWVNLLHDIQDDIFRISTELATPREKEKKIKGILITKDNIKNIENNIDIRYLYMYLFLFSLIDLCGLCGKNACPKLGNYPKNRTVVRK